MWLKMDGGTTDAKMLGGFGDGGVAGVISGKFSVRAFPVHRRNFVRQIRIAFVNKQLENTRKKRPDTVGEP
jgi:hypothetical protein